MPLKNNETEEIKETVVFKIESRSFLRKFKAKDGWGINWIEVPKKVEVFALALKDDNEIQGLVGVRNDVDAHAAYLHWACTAPHNNKKRQKNQNIVVLEDIFLQLSPIVPMLGDMKVRCMDLPLTKRF